MESARIGRIAEAVVLQRLAERGLDVYRSAFDCGRLDYIVHLPPRCVRIQVRIMRKRGKYGKPATPLRCSAGRGKEKTYAMDAFDVLVGYDLHSQTCHLWLRHELHQVAAVSATEASKEAWNKIISV